MKEVKEYISNHEKSKLANSIYIEFELITDDSKADLIFNKGESLIN